MFRGSALYHICEVVAGMYPGEALHIGFENLREIPSYEHNGATFTPADRVLGNIVGSAYTHSYRINLMDASVTFYRHEDTGERWSTDPDRRDRARIGRKE